MDLAKEYDLEKYCFNGEAYLAFDDLELGSEGEAFYQTAVKVGDKVKNNRVPIYSLTFEATLYDGCDGDSEDDYDCGLDVVDVRQIEYIDFTRVVGLLKNGVIVTNDAENRQRAVMQAYVHALRDTIRKYNATTMRYYSLPSEDGMGYRCMTNQFLPDPDADEDGLIRWAIMRAIREMEQEEKEMQKYTGMH